MSSSGGNEGPNDGGVLDDPLVTKTDASSRVGRGPTAQGRASATAPLDPDSPDGPDTVVRPRRAVPIAPPNFTAATLEPAPSAPPRAPVVSDSGGLAGTRPVQEHSLWPAVAALAILIAVAIAVGGYFLMSQQTTRAAAISSDIADARVAVGAALARIESLPVDSPLRKKVIMLDKWDRELIGFEKSMERTPEMAQRAREIASQAEIVSEEARAAGAPAIPPAPTSGTAGTPAAPASGDPATPPETAPGTPPPPAGEGAPNGPEGPSPPPPTTLPGDPKPPTSGATPPTTGGPKPEGPPDTAPPPPDKLPTTEPKKVVPPTPAPPSPPGAPSL